MECLHDTKKDSAVKLIFQTFLFWEVQERGEALNPVTNLARRLAKGLAEASPQNPGSDQVRARMGPGFRQRHQRPSSDSTGIVPRAPGLGKASLPNSGSVKIWRGGRTLSSLLHRKASSMTPSHLFFGIASTLVLSGCACPSRPDGQALDQGKIKAQAIAMAHARIDAIDPAIAKLKEAVSALERRALAAEAKIEAMLAPIVK